MEPRHSPFFFAKKTCWRLICALWLGVRVGALGLGAMVFFEGQSYAQTPSTRYPSSLLSSSAISPPSVASAISPPSVASAISPPSVASAISPPSILPPLSSVSIPTMVSSSTAQPVDGASGAAPQPTGASESTKLSLPSKKVLKAERWGGNEIGVSGLVGSWGNSPQFGLRGVLPLSRFLAFRVGWIFMFHLKGEESYNLSTFTLDLIVRLPSPYRALRYYAVTRLDFWPLWNFFNTNPAVSKISTQPTFGLSVLAGVEGFLLPRVSWFLESGFSSGMVIGFAPIRRPYEAFGFVIQSGFQTYF